MSDLSRVRDIALAALASLELSRRRIDDLNVYPVPDGDTGTNLTLTGRAIVEELERSSAADRALIAREVTRAALMGARGNSGVIFSQIVRGAADVLGAADEIDVDVLARAFRSASDAAYRGVRQPVEGTMLSAIRALADEAERRPDDFWPALLRAGDEAVVRTQQQLDVLREAGVVDAGAAGLLEIVRGIAAAMTGEEMLPAPLETEQLTVESIHQELSRYRYCTAFVVEGEQLDADALESKLEQLGDSLLVVGDDTALKVHVHTDDPGAALSLGTAVGVIERIEIANMHAQTHAREERLLEPVPDLPASAVVAVAAGEGNRKLFESFGAHVVEGGQSMNPSVGDLAKVIERDLARGVIVLPNNSNVIGAAEHAADQAEVEAHVLPTHSIQEGLSAIVVFDEGRSAAENLEEMREVVSAVATGEVTTASRDAQLNGLSVRQGEYLGLAGGSAVATGPDFDAVATAVAEQLLAEPRGVLTLLAGEDELELDPLLARLRERHPELEVDVQQGGQPHYPLLLSAE
jgi:DAK2 domain fusion protein YloV